jgi:hypothetical protein
MINLWTWDDAPSELKKMVASEKNNEWSFVATVDHTYLRLLAGSVVSRAIGKLFSTMMCINQRGKSVYFVGDVNSKNRVSGAQVTNRGY